jgi:hypothetical protein
MFNHGLFTLNDNELGNDSKSPNNDQIVEELEKQVKYLSNRDLKTIAIFDDHTIHRRFATWKTMWTN